MIKVQSISPCIHPHPNPFLVGARANAHAYINTQYVHPTLAFAHRYLGMHLADYKHKHEGGGWFGKGSKLAWLTSTQLCPVIWLIIFGLVAVFCHKVRVFCHKVSCTGLCGSPAHSCAP
jgi:hypothetical protein